MHVRADRFSSVALTTIACLWTTVGCRGVAAPAHAAPPAVAAPEPTPDAPPAAHDSAVAETTPRAPIGVPDEGQYLLTIDTPDTGPVAARVEAHLVAGAVVLTSRAHAAAELVAGWTGAKFAAFVPMNFKDGVLMRWRTSVPTEGAPAVGVLNTPLGNFVTRTASFDAPGEIRDARGGVAGTLTLEPAPSGAAPDYRTVAASIQSTLRGNFFDPAALDGPGLQRFARFLGLAAERAQDDLEFAFGAYLARMESGVSHLDVARGADAARPPAADSGASSIVRLTFDGDVATMRIARFAAAADEIDAAFDTIRDHGARGLVLDLRGNPGGDSSSLRVAAHVLAASADAGTLFDAAARADVLAGRRDTFPTVSTVLSVAELGELLANAHAVNARVVPVARPFAGPVALLVDHATASACEPLAALLQHEKRVRVFGAKTAGAMLSSRRFDVGGGWILRLPAHDYVTAWGARLEGAGVVPDAPCVPKDAESPATAWVRSQL